MKRYSEIVMGDEEVWKDIKGFKGYYKVSNTGKVKSVDRVVTRKRHDKMIPVLLKSRFMKFDHDKKGYKRVVLQKEGVRERSFVHRIVLESFVRPRMAGEICCHNNGDQNNNNVANLRWGTHKDNSKDMVKHGTVICGEKQWRSHLTYDDVTKIKMLKMCNMKLNDIGAIFGIKKSAVSSITVGRNWKHHTINVVG